MMSPVCEDEHLACVRAAINGLDTGSL